MKTRKLFAAAAAIALFGATGMARASREVSVVAAPLSSYSILIAWTGAGDESFEAVLERKTDSGRWRMIDRFTAGPSGSYTDYLLWQQTTYTYRFSAVESGRRTVLGTAEATTLPQVGPWPRLYGTNSFWNQPIPPGAATDPHSKEMVADSLVSYAQEHTNPATHRYYPESNLGMTDAWGVPIAYAHPVHSKEYDVGCRRYGCETQVSFRIPRYAALTHGSDSRLSVINPAGNLELDMWAADYDREADRWTAGSRYVVSAGIINGRGAVCDAGYHCNGAVAAGFSALGGVIRPEEIAQGHIDHALVFTSPTTRADFIACPATHTDGNTRWKPSIGKYPMPQGARIQLDPEFVVPDEWPRWKTVIAEALQTYGAYLGDTGGSVAIKGESTSVARGYDSWAKVGLPHGADRTLGDFPWDRMRVLEVSRNRGDGTCG